MSTQVYDFSIPPGGVFTVPAVGTYYKILTCSGAIEVRRDNGSRLGPILAGQGERDAPYSRLTLVDESGATNVGTILVSDTTFVDDRVTGEVSFIDGESTRIKDNKGIIGVSYCAPGVGLYSHCQVWNPGPNLAYIRQIIPVVPVAIILNCYAANADLSGLTNPAFNKKILGAASPVESRFQTNASVIAAAQAFALIRVPGASYTPYKLDGPLLLEPNTGINFVPQTLNTELILNYEGFYEV